MQSHRIALAFACAASLGVPAVAQAAPSPLQAAMSFGAGPAQVITVRNETRLPDRMVQREEDAIVTQARQLGRYWHTPPIRFGPDGWTLTLVPSAVPVCGADTSGCHDANDAAGGPEAFVSIANGRASWTDTFSHEMIEMLVDPYADRYVLGHIVEIADPVEYQSYVLDGETMSDFALPAYFTAGQQGQLDYLDYFASSCLYALKATGC